MGRKADALKAIGRSSELQPSAVEIAGLHARLLMQEGRLGEAIGTLRRIVAQRPEHSAIWNELGIALKMNGQPAEAISAWRESLSLKPDFAGAMSNLAIALLAENQIDESIELARQLIARFPEEPGGHLTLGAALLRKGDAAGAVVPLRKAAELQPDSAEVFARLADAHIALGARDEARTTLTRAIELNPQSATLQSALGKLELAFGRHDAAIESLRSAVKLDGRSAEGWSHLGRAYFAVGEIEEAADCFQRAVDIDPGNLDLRSRWIFALHHHPDADTAALLDEARKWESARTSRNFGATPNAPKPENSAARFLRVGFVIPPSGGDDVFCKLFPLFRRHNHEQFHFYAYADLDKESRAVQKMKPLVREWKDIAGRTNDQLASQVRRDRIDILIDLSQHAEGHRLPTFAANRAPLQITFGIYPGTTGLGAIQYRLTDSHLDSLPPAQIASEKTIVLPNSYWCWDPECLEETGEPSPPLPAAVNGYTTFGTLESPEKLNDELIDTWGKILKASPRSRLLLPAAPERAQKRLTKVLQEHEVSADRVEFAAARSSTESAKLLSRIDIALDPFPFCGISSSLKSLWMGVPVVTFVGQTPVGRIGLSLLANLDFRTLAASSVEQYVEIASELALDLSRLGELRANLRQRMLESPLTDSRRFTRNFEAVLRDLWERECR
jgi:predicted O-linked N-acetylglucosamine transferase (SPINDLY family)